MEISYENIGESNRKEALNLHVKKSQVGTIETVEECLEEADQLSLWRPVIIKIDDVAVAFAMYGLWI
ncbi:MAG: spermidine acetyltransferase, partial [Longicatena sp.]